MTKYFTSNKEMYFEVQKSEDIIYMGYYEIHAFYENSKDDYRYERNIPEGVYFETEDEARIVAKSLAMTYNWGNETATDNIKEKILNKIKKSLNNIE
ncbi:hypothetical protein [Metabacillus fastidiosus]|uniref:hypothetical protein n=1 Tax=Metabacillus fastidiosus TaxID=1458 RepID=UPI003D272534